MTLKKWVKLLSRFTIKTHQIELKISEDTKHPVLYDITGDAKVFAKMSFHFDRLEQVFKKIDNIQSQYTSKALSNWIFKKIPVVTYLKITNASLNNPKMWPVKRVQNRCGRRIWSITILGFFAMCSILFCYLFTMRSSSVSSCFR